ncbi:MULTISPECIES: DUF2946 family protein [unclassified Ruegeria]|uniref:DUF2946 family protein n=1 Tax=unclassified Ruegeria TaxID=2625375 RepID=UPI0014887660|nr:MULTISPECIES: DUF2946 family protein [unclassified Ruegeria]NOD47368.1 hypothetical protein [Ruegeria sp. HKCCD5849]NOD53239.1 hypothetical protein [Ruegeria sp. HKCCD5851]NOD66432.1 hypothetical protein [Ruegeria sp. HKCCD7303]NOE34079.1 hypothetical protein [Ruegeria sp. HKCCD7318]
MSAYHFLHILPDRVLRAVCGVAGALLLLLQMLGPVLASPGQSMWVEICSEAGAVWVEVDLEEENTDPTAPCPKCADCALCAVTTAGPVPDTPLLVADRAQQIVLPGIGDPCNYHNSKRLWPETRGPPFTTQEESERALRASMASTQIFGGAPWS